MITINFLGDDILLAVSKGRPWVPVLPICEQLGISPAAQMKRLMRHHERTGLEVVVIEHNGMRLLCIQVEEVHWWLRTLRPQNAGAQKRLRTYRAGGALFYALLHHWVDLTGRFTTTRDYQSRLATPRDEYCPTPPVRKTGITQQLADEWRRLKQAGHSYSQISRMTGGRYSNSTICQVLKGKYPVEIREAPQTMPS